MWGHGMTHREKVKRIERHVNEKRGRETHRAKESEGNSM